MHLAEAEDHLAKKKLSIEGGENKTWQTLKGSGDR